MSMNNSGFHDSTSPGVYSEEVPPAPECLEELDGRAHEVYEREGKILRGYGDELGFGIFLERLGLTQRFRDYMDKTEGLFAKIASEAPVCPDGPASEAMQMRWFMKAFRLMEKSKFARRLPVLPTPQVLVDHQDTLAEGISINSSGVIYHAGLGESLRSVKMIVEAKTSAAEASSSCESLGQISYYARKVWEAQPTRTFVPVLFLHGTLMTLVVFMRSGYYKVELGSFLLATTLHDDPNTAEVESAFQLLWFLLSLPPNDFGYYVDKVFEDLNFNFDGDETSTKVEVVKLLGGETVSLRERIERETPLIQRAAHLFMVDYKGKEAVLKLSWAPVSCMPECAIYDVLKRSGIKGIPQILRKGIIVKDFWGYRLEFLLMENCGDQIDDVFRSRRFIDPGKLISRVVSEVAACLFHAEKAGVLHRDISAGNITIDEGGRVTIIDWSSARLLPSCPFLGDIEQKWGLDADSILKNEARYNHLMRTSQFMPIRVLLRREERDVYDDIESLFYVACYALSHWIRACRSPPGFGSHDAITKAHLLVGLLTVRSRHLRHFGVEVCPEGAERCMAALYDILFTDGSSFIGDKLLEGEDDARVVQYDALRVILGDTHFNALFKDNSAESTDLSKTSAAAKVSTSANTCPPTKKRSRKAADAEPSKAKRAKANTNEKEDKPRAVRRSKRNCKRPTKYAF